MKRLDTLIRLNQLHLQQGLDLLSSLTDTQYKKADPPVYSSGIGEHMRHIIEHYQLLLEGMKTGTVNYDARKRDERLSSDRSFAMKTCQGLMDSLEALSRDDDAIEIQMAVTSSPDGDSPMSESTIKREMQYVQAHTIHHYALIAMIARLQDIEPPEAFGIAPSTLQHRQRMHV